jgi:hypothetical protein
MLELQSDVRGRCAAAQGTSASPQPGVRGHAGYARLAAVGCAHQRRAPAPRAPRCRRVCAAAQVTRARRAARRPRWRAGRRVRRPAAARHAGSGGERG